MDASNVYQASSSGPSGLAGMAHLSLVRASTSKVPECLQKSLHYGTTDSSLLHELFNKRLTTILYYKRSLLHFGPHRKAFLGSSVVKNLLPVQEIQEMWVQSLGQEDPLE